jgi:hypothetical protein
MRRLLLGARTMKVDGRWFDKEAAWGEEDDRQPPPAHGSTRMPPGAKLMRA